MPLASDFCGQFWSEANASEVIDSLASGCTFVSEEAVRLSSGKIRGWTLSVADRLTSNSSGKPLFGYPKPLNDPLWIAGNLVGGKFLTAHLDFIVDDTYVWFYSDPSDWADVRYFTWVNNSPIETVNLIYCSIEADEAITYDEATYLDLTQTVAQACDSPSTISQEETVEDIWQDYTQNWRIITSAAAYRLTALDTPSVEIGDILYLGTPLGSAWSLTKLGPNTPDLSYLTIPAEYHQGITTGGITWYNADTPLVVDTVSSRTRVRWILGGVQADVDAFWTASHATGIQGSVLSLAQAMDTRANPAGDPGPESLPVVVNPMEFICREVFAGNAYLLITHPSKFGPDYNLDSLTKDITKAAGPYITVFTYTNTMPALPPAVVS